MEMVKEEVSALKLFQPYLERDKYYKKTILGKFIVSGERLR
jgi:hypothetical protein